MLNSKIAVLQARIKVERFLLQQLSQMSSNEILHAFFHKNCQPILSTSTSTYLQAKRLPSLRPIASSTTKRRFQGCRQTSERRSCVFLAFQRGSDLTNASELVFPNHYEKKNEKEKKGWHTQRRPSKLWTRLKVVGQIPFPVVKKGYPLSLTRNSLPAREYFYAGKKGSFRDRRGTRCSHFPRFRCL